MDESLQNQDAPVAPATPVEEVATSTTPTDVQTTVEAEPTDATVATPTVETTETVEDDDYADFNVNLPQVQPLDFSQLPVGDDNLIDPNALAGAINQQIAAAENRAFARSQQAQQEAQIEAKGWEKAYEKFPELKSNKELRDLVQNSRIGQISNEINRAKTPEEAQKIRLTSPSQAAEKFFKYMGNAKAEGMKQATENTVIQASAHVETAGTRTDDSSDAKSKAYQNINNPNKEVAKKARNDLLKSMLFGDN